MSADQVKSRRNSKDLSFGALLLILAIVGLYINQDYTIGTARRMGPGYMPMLVFGLIGIFGVGMLITGMKGGHDPLEGWAWRELGLVLSGMTAFAALLDRIGLALAVAILVMISSFADRSQTLKGALALTAVLIAMCWVVFVQGLNIGIPFLPPVFGEG